MPKNDHMAIECLTMQRRKMSLWALFLVTQNDSIFTSFWGLRIRKHSKVRLVGLLVLMTNTG